MMSDELLLLNNSIRTRMCPHPAHIQFPSFANKRPHGIVARLGACAFRSHGRRDRGDSFLKLQHALRRLKASGVGLVNPAALSHAFAEQRDIGRSKFEDKVRLNAP